MAKTIGDLIPQFLITACVACVLTVSTEARAEPFSKEAEFDWSFLFGISTGPFDTAPGPFVAAVVGIPLFAEDPWFGNALSGDLLLGWSETGDRGSFRSPEVTALRLPIDPVPNTRLEVTTFQASPGLRYTLQLPSPDFVEIEPYVVVGMTMNAVLSRTDGPGGERVLGISRISPELEASGLAPIGGNVLLGASVGGGVMASARNGLMLGFDLRRSEMPRDGASFETITGRVGFRFSTNPALPRKSRRSPADELSYGFVSGISTGPFGTRPGPYFGSTFGIPIFVRDPLLGQSLSLDFLLGWGQTEAKARFDPPNLTALNIPAQPTPNRRLTVTTMQVVPGLRYASASAWRIGPVGVTPHVLAGIGFDLLLAATDGPRGERALGISEISPELASRGLPAGGGQAYVEGNFGIGVLFDVFDDLLCGLDVRHNVIPRQGASYETITAKVGLRFASAPSPPAADPTVSRFARAAGGGRGNVASSHLVDPAPTRAARVPAPAGDAASMRDRPRLFEYSYLFGISSGPFRTRPALYVGGTLSLPVFARDPLFGQRLSGDILFGWSRTRASGTYQTPTATLFGLRTDPVANTEFAVSTFQVVPSFKYEPVLLPEFGPFRFQPYVLAGVAFNAAFGQTNGPGGERVLGISEASPDLTDRGVPASGGGVLIGGNFGAGLDVVLLEHLLLGVEFRHNEMERRGADFDTLTGKLGFRFSGSSIGSRLTRGFHFSAAIPRPDPPLPAVVETDEELVPLRPVTFETGLRAVRAESLRVLDQAAAILRRRPDVLVSVEELAGERGGDEDAFRLARRRARVIARHLVSRGVAVERIVVPDGSAGIPVDPHPGTSERMHGRRTVLRILLAPGPRD